MDGAEDARQPLRIAGLGLEGQQIPVELVQVLGRFDQKFVDELVVVGHHLAHPGVHRAGLVRSPPSTGQVARDQ